MLGGGMCRISGAGQGGWAEITVKARILRNMRIGDVYKFDKLLQVALLVSRIGERTCSKYQDGEKEAAFGKKAATSFMKWRFASVGLEGHQADHLPEDQQGIGDIDRAALAGNAAYQGRNIK